MYDAGMKNIFQPDHINALIVKKIYKHVSKTN